MAHVDVDIRQGVSSHLPFLFPLAPPKNHHLLPPHPTPFPLSPSLSLSSLVFSDQKKGGLENSTTEYIVRGEKKRKEKEKGKKDNSNQTGKSSHEKCFSVFREKEWVILSMN